MFVCSCVVHPTFFLTGNLNTSWPFLFRNFSEISFAVVKNENNANDFVVGLVVNGIFLTNQIVMRL